jgi:hypothetical protein
VRPAPWTHLERYRLSKANALARLGTPHAFFLLSNSGDDFGAFLVPRGKTGIVLRIMASNGDDQMLWEHVSVSLEDRCPTWAEMSYVKSLFWLPTETVMQLHVPDEQHKNLHPYTLHLWRPKTVEIPLPPVEAV